MQCLGSNSSWADDKVPMPLNEGQFQAIHDLFNCSWFKRLWVRQEIGLANEEAIIMCGNDVIDWWRFGNAIFCICWKPRNSSKAGELTSRLLFLYDLVRDRFRLGGIGYAELLRNQAKLKCADPRDRVFAVLSMCREDEMGGNIKVDYSKTVEQVYRDFTLKQIMHMHSLEILSSCALNSEGGLGQLPSWVPDWRRPVLPKRLHGHHACGNSQANVKYDGE